MKARIAIFALASASALLSPAISYGDEAEVVTISIRGTKIDIPPVRVYRLSADPKAVFKETKDNNFVPKPVDSADSMLLKGKRDGLWKYLNGREEAVCTAKTFNALLEGHEFADGDVVYEYHLEKADDEKAFVERYKLQKAADVTTVDGRRKTIYAGQKGFGRICPTAQCIRSLRLARITRARYAA